LFWINRFSEHRERTLAQLIFEQRSGLSVRELQNCFQDFAVDGLALNGRWRRNAQHKNRIESSNFARHLTVGITDEGGFRMIEVQTRSGRRLRDGEQNQIENCVRPGG
jgi:hypothetical protein